MIRLLAIFLATVALADEPRQLTLPEAIQLALKNNPDLATAQQRVKIARAGIQQTEAALWPQVRVGAGYTASDNPVQAFMMTLNQRSLNMATANFNHPGTTDNFNGKVLAHWSLYDGGASLAHRQAAELNATAAGQSLDAARNDLVFEVTRAYYTIHKARQFVTTAAAAVTSLTATVAIASNRFAAGQTLKTDWLDAQVRLAESDENLIRARNALALSELVFRVTLGVGEEKTVTAATVERASRPFDSIDLNGRDARSTNSSRPELLAAGTATAAADRQVRAAQAGYVPRLNAFASYDLDSGDASHFKDSWIAGVSIELPLFDGFLTRGKIREARANLETARQQERRVKLAINLETRQAQLNLDEANARLATTGQAVTQAEESVQITKDRYTNGLALLTQLLDAETALTAARQRRAAAETDVLIAQAALDRAHGNTWKETK
ncbi:MAG: Outer membrane protein TolC [Verrucomicrobiae bacterium]|nr:Outer membrane protein TolC [Verrucomicrobiae bacterium]